MKAGKVTSRKKSGHSSCPKCRSKNIIKSGLVQGEQRWKCKDCSYQYTRIIKRGRPLWQKSLAVFLYSSGVSMNAIAGIFDVMPSTILKWVREYAKDHVPTPEENNVRIMNLDEMNDQMRKNSKNGSSTLCISIDDDIFGNGTGIYVAKQKVD